MITISANNNSSLAGMVLINPDTNGKRPAILVIHGWTSEMARYPERVQPEIDMGYIAVLFDMRGHGQTGGDLDTLSPHDHLDDCLAAYDYMMSLDTVDPDNISVFGSSYGGYLASLVSAERKVHHLLLSVPALYPDDIFDQPKLQRSEYTTEYRKRELHANENKALKAVHDFNGDLLLIEAEHDEQVDPQVMKNFRSVAKEDYDYALIKGADHSMKNTGTNEARIEVMANWFKKFAPNS